MNRVPARMVLRLLHAEATRTGDERYRITASALRTWVWRNHITRGPGGYDLREILDYITQRDRDHQRVA